MGLFQDDLTLEALNRLAANTMAEQIGIEFTAIGPDYLEAKMPVDRRTHQPFGLLHGGASVALAETLGSVAATCCVDVNRQFCVGLEINANHIRSVREGFVTGVAVASYFVNDLASIVEVIEPLRYLSVFHYYDGAAILTLASEGWQTWDDLPDGVRIGVGPAGGTADAYWPAMLEQLGVRAGRGSSFERVHDRTLRPGVVFRGVEPVHDVRGHAREAGSDAALEGIERILREGGADARGRLSRALRRSRLGSRS